jgi:hypothetical protein
MGEVYRAHDSKLNRDVALKILPEPFAQDPDRLARFEREAVVLASLNHPNIGAIYGLEESPAEAGRLVRALVLELIEGETLADRIATGPFPLPKPYRLPGRSRRAGELKRVAAHLRTTYQLFWMSSFPRPTSHLGLRLPAPTTRSCSAGRRPCREMFRTEVRCSCGRSSIP